MNPLHLLHQYRLFKANNRYSYPFLFFALGTLKSLLQFAAVAVAVWVVIHFGFNAGSDKPVTSKVAQNTALAPDPADALDDAPAVEIQAVAGNAKTGTDATIPMPVAVKPVPTFVSDVDRLVGWEWVLQQDENKFTIQYGSSPDRTLLYESAASFPTIDTVVVFPFKKTPRNQPVYGFSTGLYSSLDEARLAIAELPDSARTFGPWIRSIARLQKQIAVTLAN